MQQSRFRKSILAQAFAALLLGQAAVLAQAAEPAAASTATQAPWMDRSKTSAQRVGLVLKAMTQDEKLLLVFGYAPYAELEKLDPKMIPGGKPGEVAAGVIPSAAGYVPGIPRLGIPAQHETDASIGVRNEKLERTSLPSSLATAASWDRKVVEAGGKMIGSEARQSGFNIMLAGGINLVREPRNGRNFEYTGEDPLLAAEMGAALIRGIQSNQIVSTVKHYLINAQEAGRGILSAQISEPALRASDALAFELAIEESSPGSVMCSYNRINDVYGCENAPLLNGMLKGDWAYEGYVMSDWGAVHSTVFAANAGLDQQSGFPSDRQAYFGKLLKEALEDGSVPQARLDDMVRRILWALFDKGVIDHPVKPGPIDFAANARVSQAAAEQSLVLLKNDAGLLPLGKPRKVAIIGSHADKGVLAGGGSSGVTPVGGPAIPIAIRGDEWLREIWQPSSPMKALQGLLPQTRFSFDEGSSVETASQAAAAADLAIVFVHQWMGESLDGSLTLDGKQDEVVNAIAKANPNTIVVVQSGGAIFMPWKKNVKAIVAAFYPGAAGGEAIARTLTGEVNPSGRLPITFPADTSQFVRKEIDGKNDGKSEGSAFAVRYLEGAAVGYKWFDLHGLKPLYAFGHGLSCTSFDYEKLSAQQAGAGVSVKFSIRNSGRRAGGTVGQIYVRAPQGAGWEAPRRLVGFDKLQLQADEAKAAAITIDPRLLASFDANTGEWVIAPGSYEVQLAAASDDVRSSVQIHLDGRRFSAKRSARSN